MAVPDLSAMRPRDIVSEQQCNIEFVKTVQKHPCLYNFELPSYTRKDVTDKAWEEVALAMNMTPSACRERWRNLRAVFMRTIRQSGTGAKKKPYYLADVMQFVIPFLRPTSMTEAEKQKMQSMEFTRLEMSRLKDTPPPLASLASLTPSPIPEVELDDIKSETIEDVDIQEWCAETMPSSCTSSRKRPAEPEEQIPVQNSRLPPSIPSTSITVPETSDPVTSFVNSLMPELKEMNSAQFKAFKRRVLVLIDDINAEIPSTTRDNEYITYE